MQPADFYTGLVAELYGPLKSFSPDLEPYARFIRETGQPALELGCGDGDPLLQLRRAGLDVEGVDSSADMLQRCRQQAEAEGIEVVLHHQLIQTLDLPRRYPAIFLAGPTFTLLPDDETAAQALRAIGRHLDEEGTALIPLFVPPPTPEDQIGRVREAPGEGAVLRVSTLAVERDESERTQRTTLRYERHTGRDRTVEDRVWTLHWHTVAGFSELVAEAGLRIEAIWATTDDPHPTTLTSSRSCCGAGRDFFACT